MSRAPVSRVRRQNQLNIKDRYNEAYKKYISSQFTYNSHCLLKKLCQDGQTYPKINGQPLSKIMIEISKIMMMNELQLLFFGATIKQMKWNVIQNCLEPYIDQVTDITPTIQNKDKFMKKMQLSLLLIAYIVKIYLNDQSFFYDFKIRDLVKSNFDKMYQEWVQKVQNNFKFSPKNMNNLFKQLDKGKQKVKKQIVDYNQLVNQLFKNNGGQQQGGFHDQRPYYAHRPVNQRQKEQHHIINDKFEGIPVHQSEDQYRVPTFPERVTSNRSQMSALGLGKRQSINQLFDKGQMKQIQSRKMNSLLRQTSQQDNFLL